MMTSPLKIYFEARPISSMGGIEGWVKNFI